MIKTLQKRFVVSAMLAITVLLAFLLGAINIAHGVITERQVEHILETLTESRGSYSPPPSGRGEQRRFPLRINPSPDEVMGARFFLAVADEEGTIVHLNVKRIYAVSEDEARDLAEAAFAAEEITGHSGQFAYRIGEAQNSRGRLAVFLDITGRQNSIRNVLLASLGIGLLCWIAMLLLVMAISRRAIAPIAQNIERQKQFVTNAGHEIKTPLAIILANTDAMELIGGESKWSRNIRAQTNRLSGLMENLLTLAKMDEQAPLAQQEFSAALLLDEAIELFAESAAGKKLEVDAQLEPDVPLRANRESVMQLVSALLDNAIKYTPEGGRVSLQLARAEGKAMLRVENDCPAPPAEDLERLFDRFYRGDEARTQSSGGCGIGLSAVRAIAEAHGGSVRAEYENGRIAFLVKI